jgi:hypothetical protein
MAFGSVLLTIREPNRIRLETQANGLILLVNEAPKYKDSRSHDH